MALLPLPKALAIPANPAGGPGPRLPRWPWLAPWQQLAALQHQGPRPELGLAPRLRPALGLGGAWVLAVGLLLVHQSPVQAGSALLDRVKQNPKAAGEICAQLRSLNAQGITSTSPQAVNRIAEMQGLNATDAEILTTFVVGLHCPDVR